MEGQETQSEFKNLFLQPYPCLFLVRHIRHQENKTNGRCAVCAHAFSDWKCVVRSWSRP